MYKRFVVWSYTKYIARLRKRITVETRECEKLRSKGKREKRLRLERYIAKDVEMVRRLSSNLETYLNSEKQ